MFGVAQRRRLRCGGRLRRHSLRLRVAFPRRRSRLRGGGGFPARRRSGSGCGGGRRLDALPFQNVAGHFGRVAKLGGGLFLILAAGGVKVFLVIVQRVLPFLGGQRSQQFFQPGQVSVLSHVSSPLNSLSIFLA